MHRYATAAVGKWDAGMATLDHTPKGRGYDQSLIYFHHGADVLLSIPSSRPNPHSLTALTPTHTRTHTLHPSPCISPPRSRRRGHVAAQTQWHPWW